MANLTSTMSKNEPSGKAIASLVCGILGITFVLPLFGPILAILLGWGEEHGVARAGIILGWITFSLYALAALAFLAVLILGGGLAVLTSG